jgi:L-seryl-tRNA(Ser) seleniumtransferase
VDGLLADGAVEPLLDAWPRRRVVDALRAALDAARAVGVGDASPAEVADPARWAREARRILARADRPSLRRVVNATGVVIHTNLGRAPLARAAREAMEEATHGYANLEMDLEPGTRGSRYAHCVGLLTELTGAEDALVVNNCAAGLMLALNTVARGAGVVVSRGELVEIGGGFRVPEILERSGARLVEVGSTNRTRPEDYRAALDDGTARAVLKVHRSNFRMTGFTEEARLEELRPVARAAGVPLLHDLGSGLLADAASLGLPPEPRAPGSVEAGADLVIISGDKLLGGPQAGILVGRGELVAALRTNPMCRALRVDKATLAGLEATLRLYRDPDAALREIPVLRMLSTPLDVLEDRARRLAGLLEESGAGEVEVRPGRGAVGGGTYPGVELDSWTVHLPPGPEGADARARALRTGVPPVVGRIEEERVVLDLRTVAPEEDGLVLERIRGVLGET